MPVSHRVGNRFRRLRAICLALVVPLLAAWGALALWFQGPGTPPVRGSLAALWCVACGVSLGLRLRARAPLAIPLLVLATALLLGWWQTLAPSHERDWADDVDRLLRAEISGSQVVLHDVRNFDWRDEGDYTARWETRSYDLDRLVSADLILSYWMGPHVAHTLVSFGFDGGERVVFSLEIRKERHESFSAIGGFFRQFEQVLVAADERDIVRTRSNARGEDVYLYRLQISQAKVRALFLEYLDAANGLRRAPRFYNTLTSNCTTIVFELARLIAPALPADYRLLLSGHFAEYIHDLHGLTPGHRYAELQALGHINERALASDASGDDFSMSIRQGVPGVPADEVSP